MNIAWTALVFGFFTGFHCIGMCGPIALMLPTSQGTPLQVVLGRLLYNLGRVATYTLMGVALGLIGSTFSLAGWQQYISVLAGVFIIFLALVPASLHKLNFFSGVNSYLSRRLSKFLKNGSYSNLLVIGLLNGLLPCGPVYIALAAAIGVGSIQGSGFYMALFGLGTIPVMLTFTVAANWFSGSLRRKINKLIPVFSVLLGILFILRGLNLGIPFLSPKMEMIKQRVENTNIGGGTMDPGAAGCCAGKHSNQNHSMADTLYINPQETTPIGSRPDSTEQKTPPPAAIRF